MVRGWPATICLYTIHAIPLLSLHTYSIAATTTHNMPFIVDSAEDTPSLEPIAIVGMGKISLIRHSIICHPTCVPNIQEILRFDSMSASGLYQFCVLFMGCAPKEGFGPNPKGASQSL